VDEVVEHFTVLFTAAAYAAVAREEPAPGQARQAPVPPGAE
jgi:ribosomal protein L12E/L44/L45/RPP1/RPP2